MRMEEIRIEVIAAACHLVNRAWSRAPGDESHELWSNVSEEQRTSCIASVRAALQGQTPEQSHALWCQDKALRGWTYGVQKDETLKTHPCLRLYSALPAEQRLKDTLLWETVHELDSLNFGDESLEGGERHKSTSTSGAEDTRSLR